MAAKYSEIILALLFCYMKVTWAEEYFLTKHMEPGENFSFNRSYKPGTQFVWYLSTDYGYNLRLVCPEVKMAKIDTYCLDFLMIMDYRNNETEYCQRLNVTGPTITVQLLSSRWGKGGSFECLVTTEMDKSQAIPDAVGPVVNYQHEKEETCQCGWTSKAQARIVGGKDAGINEFPATVLLVHKRMNEGCGATIISTRAVLSAAHCFKVGDYHDTDAKHFFIVVGEYDKYKINETGAEQRINLSQVTIHEHYNATKNTNDIALLITEQEIEYSPKVGPACLPFNIKKNDIMGKFLTVTGWGLLKKKGFSSKILQSVQLQMVDDSQCKGIFKYPYVSSHQICTKTQGRDSCQGDSGGPLYYIDPKTKRYILMGIVSYGGVCGIGFGVNTDVQSYLKWIDEHLEPLGLQNGICKNPK